MAATTLFFSGDQEPIVAMSTTPINEARDWSYLYASVQIFIATVIVNVGVVLVIGGKEKNGVNSLIVTDCFANILTALVQLLVQIPSSRSHLLHLPLRKDTKII